MVFGAWRAERGSFRAAEVTRLAVVVAVSAVMQIALTIAFASVVFRDELAPSLPLGIAAMSCGLVICGVVVAIRSGIAGHLVGPQDSGPVVISALVPAIVASASAPGPTVVVLMALSSVMVGVTLFALGALRLGRLVRYLPYPVMAGFLAGTGLVMSKSAVSLLLDGITGDATGGRDAAIRVLIGAGLSVTLVVIARGSLPTERVLPMVVLGVIVAIQVALAVAGIDRSEAADRGFLLPPIPGSSLLDTEPWLAFTRADWGVVASESVGLLPLVILAPLTMLLYLGALDTLLGVDVDSDREFRLTGVVNIVSSAVGSSPSYTQFAATNLIQQMAGGRRVVPLAVALGGAVVLLAGDAAIALAPQPVVAGLLGFIALSFMIDWLWDTIGRMSTTEWVLGAGIAAAIVVFGFLPGVGLGIALTAGWFVLQYSRISGVRRLRDASLLRSNVERDPRLDAALQRSGDRVLVVEPEGFVFFGTGDSITRAVIDAADASRVDHVIVDLSSTTGADSSAAAALGHLTRWATRNGVVTIWCGMRPNVRRALDMVLTQASSREAPDLDRALELTEQARLEGVDVAGERRAPVPGVDEYGIECIFEVGDHLFDEGRPGRGLVVIVSGSAEVEGAPGARRRRVGPGAVLGEVGLVRDHAASATVVAESTVVARVIDGSAMRRMTEDAPATAAALYRSVARSLAERLVRSDAEVDHWSARTNGHPDHH